MTVEVNYDRRELGELLEEGAILQIQDGNHGEKHPKANDYVNDGIAFVMANDLKGNRVDVSGAEKIPRELADGLRIGFSISGDVLLTHKGSIGSTAVVRDVDPYIMLTPQVTYYRVNPDKLDRWFLHYAFQEPYFQKVMKSRADQATRPYIGITAQRQLTVAFPDRTTQEHIVAILKPYDDLIVNNRRRIALLEEAARQLYREWFVRLRFPGHEHTKIVDGVPEGWERKPLLSVAEPTYGYAFKSKQFKEEPVGRPVARIRDIPRGHSLTYTEEECSEDKLLENGDFVVGMDGDFHTNFWSGGQTWINQRVVRIAGTQLSTGFVRYSIDQAIRDFNATIVGSTVAHLGAKHLKEISVLCPPDALLRQSSESFESTRHQIVTLEVSSQAAARARDLLLPRLMDGRIAT